MSTSAEERKEAQKNKRKGLWIWFKYFAMKWRFRIDQARAIFGLITFAALLALGYADEIPWFQYQEFWRSEFLLTFIIFVVFLIGGYLYDRFLKLWSETAKVTVERNPYTYVPHPRERIINLAYWTYVLQSLDQIAEKLDVEIKSKDLMRPLIEYYVSLTPNTTDFEVKGLKMRTATTEVIKNYLALAKHEDLETIMNILTSELQKKKEKETETT